MEWATLAIITLLLFAPLLVPLGLMIAFSIRRLQTHPQDRRPIRFTRRRVLLIPSAFAGLCAVSFCTFIYVINGFADADMVYATSMSPSGRLTLTTREGCLGHACFHQAYIEQNNGWFIFRRQNSCRLGIISDGIEFGPGSTFIWSPDERHISWSGDDNSSLSGVIDLHKDCAGFRPDHSG